MKSVHHSLRDWLFRWQSWPLALRCLFVGFIAMQSYLFFVAGMPGIQNSKAIPPDPFLKFVPLQAVSEYDATSEQAMLFDTAPIFIPTRWNAIQQKQIRKPVSIPSALSDFEPEIDLYDQMSAAAALEPNSGSVESPPDLLSPRFFELFKSDLELPEGMQPFSDSTPTAYYRNADSKWLPLPIVPDLSSTSILASPVTFYVNISSSRAQDALPRQANESGVVAFDRAAQKWLSSPEVLAQLPIGYSEVVVYP